MENVFAASAPTYKSTDTSFFELVARVFDGSDSRRDPFHRFVGLMRILAARFFIEEDLDTSDPELAYERDAARLRLGRGVRIQARRFTFFRGEPPQGENVDELAEDFLLGYAVVVTLEATGAPRWSRTYLHESVVAWPMPQPTASERELLPVRGLGSRENYYLHCTREMKTRVGQPNKSRVLRLHGSFFTQQSNLVSVCAHAAIRMALNSTRLFEGKLTNEDINRSLRLTFDSPRTYIGHSGESDDSSDRKRGLTESEIRRVIDAQGFNIIRLDLRQDTSVDYDRFVYPFMESGLPVILGIDGHDTNDNKQIRHVVTILGHSLNADRWAPEAQAAYAVLPKREHLSAEDWTDHFIINDDQHGMYATVQTELLRSIIVPSKNPSLHTILALAIVPKLVKLSGHTAEIIGALTLRTVLKEARGRDGIGRWVKELHHAKHDYNSRVVCRPILMTKADYRRNIARLVLESNERRAKHGLPELQFTPVQIQKLEMLPEWLWVCELTVPQLYTCNVKKLGEAVIDATIDVESSDDQSGDLLGTVRLIWFDGLWTDDELTERVEVDWPVSDLASLYRQS